MPPDSKQIDVQTDSGSNRSRFRKLPGLACRRMASKGYQPFCNALVEMEATRFDRR